jgi:hypothetical protein
MGLHEVLNFLSCVCAKNGWIIFLLKKILVYSPWFHLVGHLAILEVQHHLQTIFNNVALNILGNTKVPYKELINSLHIELKAQQEMCWKQFLASKHMQRV